MGRGLAWGMKSMMIAGLVCAVVGVSGCARGPTAEQRATSERERMVAMMVGSFSSAEQAKVDPENYRDIRLHMARIWPERTDGAWLYVEQAAATALDKPYRQRVYRVHAEPAAVGGGEVVVVSEVFVLPGDAVRFAGAWREPAKLAGVTPEQLTLKDGCAMLMQARPDGTFVGGTQGTLCASELRGAKYATSEATITPTGLRTWDRGFDADGKQVWGATAGGYEFRRVE
jgi:CpeT protein